MPGRARPPRTSPITRPAPMVRPPPMSCWGAMVTPGTLSSADAASCLRSMVSGFRRLDGPVLVDAFNDVDRPALPLEEETPEIFADDAERQELDGAHQQDDDQQRGVARGVDAEDQYAGDDEEGVEDGNGGNHHADIEPGAQRRSREAHQTVEGEVPQSPQVELARARSALRPLVGHADGIESYPGEQAFHEAVALGKLA